MQVAKSRDVAPCAHDRTALADHLQVTATSGSASSGCRPATRAGTSSTRLRQLRADRVSGAGGADPSVRPQPACRRPDARRALLARAAYRRTVVCAEGDRCSYMALRQPALAAEVALRFRSCAASRSAGYGFPFAGCGAGASDFVLKQRVRARVGDTNVDPGEVRERLYLADRARRSRAAMANWPWAWLRPDASRRCVSMPSWSNRARR